MGHRRDIDDDVDDLLGYEQATRLRAERQHRCDELERQSIEAAEEEAIYQAERAQRRATLTEESNARELIAGYYRHQVEPPLVNGDGIPTCSIDLLFNLGWTIIVNDMMMKELVRPVYAPAKPKSTEGT